MTYSAIVAAIGMAVIVTAPVWQVVVLGYALLGLGCSNIVPVMFSRVGRQNNMPKAAALSFSINNCLYRFIKWTSFNWFNWGMDWFKYGFSRRRCITIYYCFT